MVSKNVITDSCEPPVPMKSHQTADVVISNSSRENENRRQETHSLLLTQQPGWRDADQLTTSDPNATPHAGGPVRPLLGPMSHSTRSLGACLVSMTASSIVDQGEYFFDDEFSVPFDANLREENNNTTDVDEQATDVSDGELERRVVASSRSDPNLTSSLLFTSAEGEAGGALWSDEQRSDEEEEEGEESGSFLSTSGGEGANSDPNPAVANLLRRPMRGEYRLTYVNNPANRCVGASASMDFQVSATTSGGTAADSECSSGSNLSTWASLARSNSPLVPSARRREARPEPDSSAPSTLKASRRLTTWSQLRSSSSRESVSAAAAAAAAAEKEEEEEQLKKLTTWKQMKRVASSKFVSWRELKEVVRGAEPPPVPAPAPVTVSTAAAASSPTAVQMRGRTQLRQSVAEPLPARSRSADNQNRYSGTLLELFKRTHAYDGGAGVEELTAPEPGPPLMGAGLRRSFSISPVRATSQVENASPAEWFGRLFSENSLSPVCSFEARPQACWGRRHKAGTSTDTAPGTMPEKQFRNFGAQFPPALPPGVKLRPRSHSQQTYPCAAAPQQGEAAPQQARRASTGQTAALNTKRITYPNAQALKVPLPAKSKRLVSSAWGTIGTTSQSMMALPDLSFLSRHLTRLKEQEKDSAGAGPSGTSTPKLRRSNSCAASVNRNPQAGAGADSPPDSGINTSADSIPVAYDLIQLDGEPLPHPGVFRARPASSEPDLLTGNLSPLMGGRRSKAGGKPLKPCLVRPRGEMANSSLTTASSSSSSAASSASSGGQGASAGGNGGSGTGEFRAKKSVSFSEKILFHQAPAKAAGQSGRSRPLSLVDNLRVIPNKVGLYGDEELFMAFAPVCSPETSPVKETGPSMGERPTSEVDRRYQALVAEVIQSVHRMVAHFTGDSASISGPPMSALLPPLSTLVCDGLNSGGGRAAGLFAKFRNRLWPVVEESCRQGVSHRALSEVLREVKALPGITTEKTKFKAFVCACLNSKCLPMWLNAVATNESLLRRHFCEDAFLRQAASTQRELFADLITSLELLLGLPFRLDVAAEAKRANHAITAPNSSSPAATPSPTTSNSSGSTPTPLVTGQQPMRARHDIKVKHHQPLHPSHSANQQAEAGPGLKGRWRYALGMSNGAGVPAATPRAVASTGGKTRIPVGTGHRSGSPTVSIGAARGHQGKAEVGGPSMGPS